MCFSKVFRSVFGGGGELVKIQLPLELMGGGGGG